MGLAKDRGIARRPLTQQQCLTVSAQNTVHMSAAFGVPHRRRRFFLVASLYGDARDVLLSQARARPPRT